MYYKQVFIKSEADLPPIRDKAYIAHEITVGVDYLYHTITNSKHWLSYIDWYLQPIEQPEIIMPTIVEAETKAGLLVETILKPTIARHRSEGFLQCYDWFRDEVIKRNKREIE
jgi:hypothetical protein